MEMLTEDIRFKGEAESVPPPNLLAVAYSEMSGDDFRLMLILQGDRPLTPEAYVKYIETIRKEGRL